MQLVDTDKTVDRLVRILDAAGESILSCEKNGDIEYANLAAERLFGYVATELRGLKIDRLIPSLRLNPRMANHEAQQLLGQKKGGATLQIEVAVKANIYQNEHQYTVVVTEVAQTKNNQSASTSNETLFRAIFDTAIGAIIVIDDHGTIEYFNPGAENLFGYAADEALGHPVTMLMPEPERSEHPRYIERYKRTGNAHVIGIGREVLGQRKDRSLVPVLLSVAEIITNNRRFFTAILHDLTDLQKARAEILASENLQKQVAAEKQRLLVTLESIADAVITTDASGIVDYINPAAQRMTGWTLQAASGRPISDVFVIIREEDQQACRDPVRECLTTRHVVCLDNHVLLLARNGNEYSIHDSAAPILDENGQVAGAVLVFSDVTRQRQLLQQINYQARYDPLTDLVNRWEFEKRLQRVLDSAQKNHIEHAICYLDLDHFKAVNDIGGHAAGDELLRQISTVLQKHIRSRDTLGRLGGDEFGIIMEHCSLQQARICADTIRKAVETFRFNWMNRVFNVDISIGVVAVSDQDRRTTDLLIKADEACYAAKRGGRNRIHVLQADDKEFGQQYSETNWASRINHCVKNDCFVLFFQQIRSFNDPDYLHYELLLRLLKPDGNIVLPGTFMPAAERYGLATKIDRRVIQKAFAWLGSNPSGIARLSLCAINISGQSLGRQDMLDHILEQFDQTQVPAEKICFEITETAAIGNLNAAIQFMDTLTKIGCRFALDDFGTGLASFAYLKNLPVDYLKIDGAFVKNMVDDPNNLAVIKSINEIGHVMGKQTIAECVEDEQTLHALKAIGVDSVQGYAIHKPVWLV